MNAKVSVLVPIYNVSPYIKRCADSLFNQTFESIEFVFVNDCTTDNSIEILAQVIEQFPHRNHQIKIIHHEANKGIGQTRKTLLENATSDYILWVDSDDYISNNAVEFLVTEIEKSGAEIITTESYKIFKSASKILNFTQHFPNSSKEYIDALAYHKVRAALWGTLSKRSIWVENQLSFLPGLNFGEDYLATVQLVFHSKKLQIADFPYYFYNQTNIHSYTTGYKKENHFSSLIKLFENIELFFQKQQVAADYDLFLRKAKIKEFSGLLLHTTPELRRKYNFVLNYNDFILFYSELMITKTQKRILIQLIKKRNLCADCMIIIAKLSRSIFNTSF